MTENWSKGCLGTGKVWVRMVGSGMEGSQRDLKGHVAYLRLGSTRAEEKGRALGFPLCAWEGR